MTEIAAADIGQGGSIRARVDAAGCGDHEVVDRAGQLYTLLAQAGHHLTWTDYITARNPNPDDASTLHVPDGTPIIITRRITHDTDNTSPSPWKKPTAAPTTPNSPTGS